MRQTKAILEDKINTLTKRLISTEDMNVSLQKEITHLKDQLGDYRHHWHWHRRINEQLIEVLNNGAKEGNFPRKPQC